MTTGLFVYWLIGTVAILFGICCAFRASSPWGIDLKLSDSQFRAVSKRIADALEKLSIGCLLYWVFQERIGGLLLAVFCIGISLAITIEIEDAQK